MEENTSESVYGLITALCEKFSTNPNTIKKFRATCYEILLGKKVVKNESSMVVPGTSDAFYKLLAWQFDVSFQYGLWDYGRELKKCAEEAQIAFEDDTETFNNVLEFLLGLRSIPNQSKKLDISSLPLFETPDNFEELFTLPHALICESAKYCDNSFYLKPKPKMEPIKEICSCGSIVAKISCKSMIQTNHQDPVMPCVENYYLPEVKPLEENIWELAAKLEYNPRKTWESHGMSEPDKEPPFLSELGESSSLWVENLQSLYISRKLSFGNVYRLRLRPMRAFLKDVKYLMVGMASESFGYNHHGEFYLIPGVTIDGITPNMLETYSKDLIVCGNCYKALDNICKENTEHKGYIFKELCESIERYLQFYRTATMSMSDGINLLDFRGRTNKILYQILTLTKICKVGPYKKSDEMPHGVALLNYLYQEVLTLTDNNIVLVLYSILYSCCQVYTSRFLTPWILAGVVNDPYGEFFIKPNLKYVVTRGRTYWTRSFSLCEDLIPNFWLNLKMDILSCGKNINLLKLCLPSSKICLYLMGQKPLILTCCITADQLLTLRQNTTRYYLEVSAECGTKFNLAQTLAKSHEEDPLFMNMIAKKRVMTLKRLELERQLKMEKENEKRQEELAALREQYESAVKLKQSQIAIEIQREMQIAQENIETEKMRETLVEAEATRMIEYYAKLCAVAEERKAKAEQNIKSLQKALADSPEVPQENPAKVDSSSESFYSAGEKSDEALEEDEEESEEKQEDTKTLDIINANATEEVLEDENCNNDVHVPLESHIQMAIDNFEMARKIKRKVLTEEMGLDSVNPMEKKKKNVLFSSYEPLTAAQKNRLRVMSSEFDVKIPVKPTSAETKIRTLSAAETNKLKVLGSDRCFLGLDNESFIKKNMKIESLHLDIALKDKPETPMSVDSTPLSDLPQSTATTPSTTLLSVNPCESIPTTGDTTILNSDIFEFEPKTEPSVLYMLHQKPLDKSVFSKRVSIEAASGVSTNCLSLFLHESIAVPLAVHAQLVNNELLRVFVQEQHYLEHLNSLRMYFFLQDGEFARSITENLFERLYNANVPADVINCRTLQHLVFDALDNTCKFQENRSCLSFKINNLPQCFDLGNPDVLECVSLTYKVNWPLNVLLPGDTIGKYDEVFKYLLKLNRMSWVLNKIFLELKVLARETGKKEIYLMMSPQYRQLHLCRHVMLHFVQTLQNYVVGEVLQTSWDLFEKHLATVKNLDEMYSAHTSYIKQILFMCFLNKKSAVFRKVIHKIFVVILKFYDYLRSRCWECTDGAYVHPNFKKLECIFENFEAFVLYLFKVCQKVIHTGYQPHLMQLLNMLNANDYYTKKKLK